MRDATARDPSTEAHCDEASLPSAWKRAVLRPAVIAFLITCPALGLVAVSRAVDVPFATSYIAPLVFLVALVSVHSYRHLSVRLYAERMDVKVAQLVVLIVLARLVTLVIGGPPFTWSVVGRWLWSPLDFLLDIEFFAVAALTLAAWLQAQDIERTFWDLGENKFYYASQPNAGRDVEQPLQGASGEAMRALGVKFAVGGLILTSCAAITQVDLQGGISRLALTGAGLSADLVLALVGYVLAGLILVSQARWLSLYAGWTAQGIGVAPSVRRGWARVALLFVATVALAAAFIPIGSTTAFARVLYDAVTIIDTVAAASFGLLLALLHFLGTLLGLGQPPGADSPIVAPPPQPVPTAPVQSVAWLERISAVALWIVLAAIAGYSLFIVYRSLRRDGRLNLRVLWQWLKDFLSATRRRPQQLARHLSSIRVRLGSRGRKLLPPLRSPDLRTQRWTAEERVRRYYLTIVRRAGQRGVPRSPSATPQEYRHQLVRSWPDHGEDIDLLTEAFMMARYSGRPIARAEEQVAREACARLKRHLRLPITPQDRSAR